MVLLVTTDRILAALDTVPASRREQLNLPATLETNGPIAHEQLIRLSRYLQTDPESEYKDATASSPSILNSLLRGTKVYVPPPPPKPEPVCACGNATATHQHLYLHSIKSNTTTTTNTNTNTNINKTNTPYQIDTRIPCHKSNPPSPRRPNSLQPPLKPNSKPNTRPPRSLQHDLLLLLLWNQWRGRRSRHAHAITGDKQLPLGGYNRFQRVLGSDEVFYAGYFVFWVCVLDGW